MLHLWSLRSLNAPRHWAAKWIWHGCNRGSLNAFAFFRKRFSIDLPTRKRALVSMTADSRYRLWINGVFVSRGPARCSPDFQSFDVMDVTDLLRDGGNCICILAHHFGVTTTSYSLGRPGLLFQLDVDGAAEVVSDGTWRSLPGDAWGRTPLPEHSWGGTEATPPFQRGFIEIVDGRLFPVGWTGSDYDDAGWKQAKPVDHPRGWPRKTDEPTAVMRPWTRLVERDLPPLREEPRRPVALMDFHEVVEYAKLSAYSHDPALVAAQDIHAPAIDWTIDGECAASLWLRRRKRDAGPFIDDTIRSPYLVLDFGRQLNGHVTIVVSGPAGTTIDLVYASHLVAGQVAPTQMNARNADRLILPEGRFEWEGQNWRNLRYLAIIVRGSESEVVIDMVGATEITYPFSERGSIATGNAFIDRLWTLGANTVVAVTSDAFQDNCREQFQYVQTGFYTGRAAFTAFGDTFLQRRLLIQASQSIRDGLIPAAHPGGWSARGPSSIIESNFFFALGLRDHFMNSGDAEFARSMIPVVEGILERFSEMSDGGGLLADIPYEYWIDHAPIERLGTNFCLNCLYLMAVEAYEQLHGMLGMAMSGERGVPDSAAIRASLEARFLTKTAERIPGSIRNDGVLGACDEHANAMALSLGLCGAVNGRVIAGGISDAAFHPLVSPLYLHFVVEGLAKQGMIKEALVVLEKRLGAMAEHGGTDTLWEGYSLFSCNGDGRRQPSPRTVAQAESCFMVDSLVRHVLGIERVAPNAIVVQHVPLLGRLAGRFYAKHGQIDVERLHNATGQCVRMQMPIGTVVWAEREGGPLHGVTSDVVVGNRRVVAIDLGLPAPIGGMQ